MKASNVTGLPIKIYTETNSWGASRWRVLRIRNKDQRSGDGSIRFEAGDTIVVICDLPYQPPDSWTLKVWHGVVAASTTIP
jgi:hypothetical protein